MSVERGSKGEIPYVPFPQNPERITIGGFEVVKYIPSEQMALFIDKLSQRNPMREFDEVLVNWRGGWELFVELKNRQNYRKWPYQCEFHRHGRITMPVEKFLYNKKVLIVDDSSESGLTLKEIFRWVGPESQAVVAVARLNSSYHDPWVDSAVIVDDVKWGGMGMDIGLPGEKQIFRQYRGIVAR